MHSFQLFFLCLLVKHGAAIFVTRPSPICPKSLTLKMRRRGKTAQTAEGSSELGYRKCKLLFSLHLTPWFILQHSLFLFHFKDRQILLLCLNVDFLYPTIKATYGTQKQNFRPRQIRVCSAVLFKKLKNRRKLSSHPLIISFITKGKRSRVEQLITSALVSTSNTLEPNRTRLSNFVSVTT